MDRFTVDTMEGYEMTIDPEGRWVRYEDAQAVEAELTRVRTALSLTEADSDADPVAVINMLRSWEADAQARSERLAYHLRSALEIARTWKPDYATAMDLKTLELAAAEIGDAGARTQGVSNGQTK